jgi:hypothetical protein
MATRYRRLDQPSIRRAGICKLCGRIRAFTKTHAPAEAADNTGPVRVPVQVLGDDQVWRYGLSTREYDGGMNGRWFCDECNNRTGRWDEEYLRWRPDLLVALDRIKRGNRISGVLPEADPGAFVRCLWAWGFALADNLRAAIPVVADAVRSGDPDPPPAFKLLLAATREDRSSIFVTPHSVNVCNPPFVASVIWPRLFAAAGGYGMVDIGSWLLDPVGARRSVTVDLPIMRVHGPEGEEFPVLGLPVTE